MSISQRSSLESLSSYVSVESIDSIPDSFPPPAIGTRIWHSDSFGPEQYVVRLSQMEVQDIRAAVVMFKVTGRPRSEISQNTFILPSELAEKLRACSEQVHNGIGLSVVRGLDHARFNDEESVIAFVGVSCYVCPERATDPYANQTLSHVRDASKEKVPEWAEGIGLAGSKLPTAMEFHADRFSGDVLALYIQNTGGKNNGGDQHLASFGAIYNELLETDPEVIDTLAKEDWPFEIKSRESKLPYIEPGPAIFFSKGRPMCQLVRAPLLGSPRIPRSDEMPKLSAIQMRALHAVENTASKMSIQLDRQQGDIQFVHNLSVMHARSAYGSKTTGPSERHLLRLFLRDPQLAWSKPNSYSHMFDAPFQKGLKQEIPVLDTDPWRKVSGMLSHG